MNTHRRSILRRGKSSDLAIIICIILFCSIILITHVVKLFTPLKYKLKVILNCKDQQLQMETLQNGQYWLLKNYIRGRLSTNMECAQSITYTTHGDYTFLGNLVHVVERWLAPISVAIFAPGYDYNGTMDSIQYLRNCLPSSQLIRDYVTFHINFPMDHMPSFIAKNEAEALKWPFDCKVANAPYQLVQRANMYKTQNNLTFPVNVERNIARRAANTYFILASDIEIYPSLGLVDQFLEMIIKNPLIISHEVKRKVFALPIFELRDHAELPNSKEDLQNMLNKGMAIPFHLYVCEECHLVPRQDEWVKEIPSKDLTVFSVGKRYDQYYAWEPFYISDNREPMFDERFSWEGGSNKRIQNYAMCLLDYEYHVLHPAFLVHSPGIKIFDIESEETKKRMLFVNDTNKMINNRILDEYLVIYGNNTRCKI